MPDLTTIGIICATVWAVVQYVNRKVEKVADDRKEGDILVHNRINKLSEVVYEEKGYHRGFEKAMEISQIKNIAPNQ